MKRGRPRVDKSQWDRKIFDDDEPWVDREALMERAAAALCFIDSHAGNNEARRRELELRGFMAIFHPEYTEDQIRELLRE
jgi:hypothetical protein